MEEFIKNFAKIWDETDEEEFTPSCRFHELDEWSSLIGLGIINMCDNKYGVKIKPTELKAACTIADVYKLISK